jgi:uncharacterized repeat protein (TIGR03803 family)
MPENPSRVSGVRQSPRSVHHASVTETVLYSFGGYSTDGKGPEAGLTYFKGTLYGTTSGGGSSGNGTVYSVTPSGTETVLHGFKGAEDGANPHARLIVRNDILYGTTENKGEPCRPSGCGTVFSITPSGHETVLHGFTGFPDGRNPEARLLNVNGTLYGTTSGGGSFCERLSRGCGTMFSITPGGKEKVLYSFGNGTDGEVPESGLIDVKGTLYGTTYFGGPYDSGTVFSITPGGKEKVLHSFGPRSGNDGSGPSGLVDVSGTLYGTTYEGGSPCESSASLGCGTVFSITPSGTEKVLYTFVGGSDGAHPAAALLNVNGTLYGTAGGGADGNGIVFSITLSGHETVLYSFMGGQDGAGPSSGVIDVNGALYGTTAGGGAYGSGTVYSITL